MNEVDEKLDRVVRLCHRERLDGVLLTTQANFAWITGGQSNRIDGSREPGAGAILITADGRRSVLANRIEMARLLDEALVDCRCQPVDYAWVDDHADPANLVQLAGDVAGGPAVKIGADWPMSGAVLLDRASFQEASALDSGVCGAARLDRCHLQARRRRLRPSSDCRSH